MSKKILSSRSSYRIAWNHGEDEDFNPDSKGDNNSRSNRDRGENNSMGKFNGENLRIYRSNTRKNSSRPYDFHRERHPKPKEDFVNFNNVQAMREIRETLYPKS